MLYLAGARGRLHYRRWQLDNAQAALALLPGIGQHSAHYHRFARALAARGIELWALDTSGHGLSEGDPDRPGNIHELAADARLFLEQVHAQANSTPFLLGHSLGAATALAVLRDAEPGEFSGLVLSGTPKAVLEGKSPKSARGADSPQRGADSPPRAADSPRRGVATPSRAHAGARSRAAVATERDSDWPGPRLPEGLPVLIVHGEDDRRAPLDPVRDWAAQVGARFTTYPHAGHDLLHEPVHAEVTAEIVEFVHARSLV
ncbi:alpha/beta hydrolase [Nocardia sp. CDC160]|uniref:alpha/beta hydrolase n=1 Tax=Nocardia sp. CDC160 TaxID=3112166 RepID=UPI002DB6706B|nr:alpha/beta fold hydrolase [Nocardia sp. CDC160]MEC3916616.1 alpha/beta fold hydrolase [Nocardia sp. CDC160]